MVQVDFLSPSVPFILRNMHLFLVIRQAYFPFLMAEIAWLQKIKNRNYHKDIVLRMASSPSGERILLAAFRNTIDSFDSIMGIA